MERLVLVHGSVVGGRATWAGAAPARRAVRARRRRAARLPAESAGRSRRLRAGRAARRGPARSRETTSSATRTAVSSRCSPRRARPELIGSLTVIEPPATRVAAGDPGGRRVRRGGRSALRVGRDERSRGVPAPLPRSGRLGVRPPTPLPPELDQGARALAVERGPWEAEIPLAALAAAPFPKLVVSGAHHPAFDAICDVLERELPPSARSCRATATPSSATPSSTTSSPTSSNERRRRRRPVDAKRESPSDKL